MWKMAGSAIAGAGLLAARRYYRNWGTTKEECETPLPGDELLEQPAVQTTEGIWIDAPAAQGWPWLVRRLLVRTRSRMRVPGEALGAEAFGPVMALMTRGMLLGIKRRVEQSP